MHAKMYIVDNKGQNIGLTMKVKNTDSTIKPKKLCDNEGQKTVWQYWQKNSRNLIYKLPYL